MVEGLAGLGWPSSGGLTRPARRGSPAPGESSRGVGGFARRARAACRSNSPWRRTLARYSSVRPRSRKRACYGLSRLRTGEAAEAPHRVLVLGRNPNPAERGAYLQLLGRAARSSSAPQGPVLVSCRPLGGARAARPNVTPLPTPSPSCRAFGPWSASRPLAAVEGSGGTQHGRAESAGGWSLSRATPCHAY